MTADAVSPPAFGVRLDGPEASRRIVAMTVDAMPRGREACLHARMGEYANEPVPTDRLVDAS